MNRQSIKNLQVALACQVTQKNALTSAVKLARLCLWAESDSSSAEVCVALWWKVISTWSICLSCEEPVKITVLMTWSLSAACCSCAGRSSCCSLILLSESLSGQRWNRHFPQLSATILTLSPWQRYLKAVLLFSFLCLVIMVSFVMMQFSLI